MKIYIGIDPGKRGGIVTINDKCEVISKNVMPITKDGEFDIQKIYDMVDYVEPSDVYVCLEKAWPRPISGKRQCFNTGYGYGILKTIVELVGCNYEIITPMAWMKELKINNKEGKGSIEFCKRKWPKEDWTATKRCKKPHDGITDSAGLALYCYRRNR